MTAAQKEGGNRLGRASSGTGPRVRWLTSAPKEQPMVDDARRQEGAGVPSARSSSDDTGRQRARVLGAQSCADPSAQSFRAESSQSYPLRSTGLRYFVAGALGVTHRVCSRTRLSEGREVPHGTSHAKPAAKCPHLLAISRQFRRRQHQAIILT